MSKIELRAYSGVTGERIRRIPYLKLTWQDVINEPGQITVTTSDRYDVENLCRPFATILCIFFEGRIIKAGYVTHCRRYPQNNQWTVDCGGCLTIMKKRLVLNHKLATSWRDGKVTVDVEHPSGDWPLSLKGSYSDIVRGLLVETMKWGTLPIDVKAYEGGGHERNYNSFDLATVYDRIKDITQLEDGPEVRFDAYRTATDGLRFRQRTEEEIIDHRWRWNATLPSAMVVMEDIDVDSDDMCTQSFVVGGRDNDQLLVAKAESNALVNLGYPVLQYPNNDHTSVSELTTLQSYAKANVNASSKPPTTIGLKVNMALDVKVGDWADVRTHKGLRRLKITDVSGSADDGMLKLQARERV